ncbi:unnamed protein product [Kuraishia capsulata CBS 1993]|uniref:non-specific serine/threonine protein kinase n=1 Tax=Kuraishia capsulata CBS 1993 TaxID=1382522 RepID=W6MLJ3_9ASCO|nr:uncharacterized protein KUCA_T00001667001 [Kuraishia capsulata CBS 1993]CDK25697.1 unnamed protein product [Kuraishia capsulata CBS 1993]
MMTGFFGRSSKSPTGLEDLTRDVEGMSFEDSTPNSSPQRFRGSPRSNQSSPNRTLEQFFGTGGKHLERLNFTSNTNKENTPPTTPARNLLPPSDGAFARSSPVSNSGSPNRLPKDFYTKANDPKTRRLVTVCQMYFLDYYCDMFDYLISRKERVGEMEKALDQLHPSERQYQWRNYVGRERALLRKRRIKPRHKDFSIITQVGQGGYGQVFLARKRDTKEICALKVLNKRLLMRTDETRHVLTERDILTNTRSEWLVKLFYAFQDPENVYLAMEFVAGGDFRTLLSNAGYLIPPHARFYISEMFAAVNALHQLGYTHRDLKPENFLIDNKGHIKLTDFGLAAGSVSSDRIESMRLRLNQVKDLEYHPQERTFSERQQMYKSLRAKDIQFAHSIVGSPDYMALEVLEGKPYDYTIDYWSLGCMLFEAIAGYTPFSGSSTNETYANLKRWKDCLKRPTYENGRYVFSDRTWQLITRLIASPKDRLRSLKQVMAMPYFAEVNWDHLRERVPPFTPQLDDEEDAGYFDDFTNEADLAKYKEVMRKRAADERTADKGGRGVDSKNFVGFTFKHKKNPNASSMGILTTISHNEQSNITPSANFRRHDDPFSTLY